MNIKQIHAEIRDLMEQAAQFHRQGRHSSSLQSYQKAIALALPLGDTDLMALLLSEAGGEHRDCDNYYHAIELMVAALALVSSSEEAASLRARIKKLLAITFRDIYGPEKQEVLELLEEARADYARSGDSISEANVMQHISGCYLELDRFPEADGLLQEALRKVIAANDIQLQGWILNNMAELEIERDQWGLALDYTRNARVKLHTVQDLEGEGDTWVTEVRIQLRMGHIEDALAAATRALELYNQNQNQRRSIRARRHLTKVLIRLGRVDEAMTVLNEALRTATGLNLLHDQALVYLDLGNLELARKNYGLAQQYATYARRLADEENLSDLLGLADDLLRRCLHEENPG